MVGHNIDQMTGVPRLNFPPNDLASTPQWVADQPRQSPCDPGEKLRGDHPFTAAGPVHGFGETLLAAAAGSASMLQPMLLPPVPASRYGLPAPNR